ncbi:MAG: hypothetical protein AAF633_12990 [Chloroflexota bacterium]
MNYFTFIRTLPEKVLPQLPARFDSIKVYQPFRWVIQFHFGEPRLHYEVGRVPRQKDFEIGFHFEAKDKTLNKYLLLGFRRHLFEIKDGLGKSVEAEMWDRGWTKIYDRVAEEELSDGFQTAIADRLVEMIVMLHPIFVELRQDVNRIYR